MNDSPDSPESADSLELTWTQYKAHLTSRADANPGGIMLAQHETSLRDRC